MAEQTDCDRLRAAGCAFECCAHCHQTDTDGYEMYHVDLHVCCRGNKVLSDGTQVHAKITELRALAQQAQKADYQGRSGDYGDLIAQMFALLGVEP